MTAIDTTTDHRRAGPPTALFASAQHWRSHLQVGSHHIARAFARRGWRVGFVSAPVGPLHLAGFGTDAVERVASWRAGGSIDPVSRVWHYVPFAPLPWGSAPIVRNRLVGEASWRLCGPLLASVLRRAGFDRPRFACADHFLHEGLLRAARPELTVFRRADNQAGFPGAGADFAAREADFARRADLTLCTTDTSAADLATKGVRDTLVVRNGFDPERFCGDAPLPVEYVGDPRPIVVYVGAAESWLDFELLQRGVTELGQFRWVFVGNFEGAMGERLRGAGASVLGPRMHDRLAGYLCHAHVGIVPFSLTRSAELIREVSPLKVLEYSACGLPVVGTRGCQYPQDLPTPLVVCDTADAFLDAVAAFARRPRPPRPSIAQFAGWSWQARLEPLFAWLQRRGESVAASCALDAA